MSDERTLDDFRREVDRATGAMLALVDERESWTATEMYAVVAERTGVPKGPALMTALCDLANPEYDGRLELDPHLRIRRAGHMADTKRPESPSGEA